MQGTVVHRLKNALIVALASDTRHARRSHAAAPRPHRL